MIAHLHAFLCWKMNQAGLDCLGMPVANRISQQLMNLVPDQRIYRRSVESIPKFSRADVR